MDSSPEENEFVNKDFYHNNEYAYFNQFIWCLFPGRRYREGFSAMILDENKNLVYNRDMIFESDGDYELREYLKSDLIAKPKEIINISKRIFRTSYWSLCNDEDPEVKGILYEIDNSFLFKLIAKLNRKFL